MAAAALQSPEGCFNYPFSTSKSFFMTLYNAKIASLPPHMRVLNLACGHEFCLEHQSNFSNPRSNKSPIHPIHQSINTSYTLAIKLWPGSRRGNSSSSRILHTTTITTTVLYHPSAAALPRWRCHRKPSSPSDLHQWLPPFLISCPHR